MSNTLSHTHSDKGARLSALRPTLGGIILIAVLTIVLGCAEESSVARPDPLDADEISGQALWDRITDETSYSEYDFWPSHEGMRLGQAPHGAYHKIFINPTLREAIPAEDRTAPNGSIIVKENFTADRDLREITVMAKVEGVAPETNDWFWARYTNDGEVEAEGSVGRCISCHTGMRSNDYVIVQPLNRAPEDTSEDTTEDTPQDASDE